MTTTKEWFEAEGDVITIEIFRCGDVSMTERFIEPGLGTITIYADRFVCGQDYYSFAERKEALAYQLRTAADLLTQKA